MNTVRKHALGLLIHTMLCLMLSILFFETAKVQAAESMEVPQMTSVTQMNGNQVQIKWKKVANADGYRVYRRTAGQSWSKIYTNYNPDVVSFVDQSVVSGTRYFYTVRAYQKNGSEVIWSGYEKYGLTIIASFTDIHPWKYTKEQLKSYKPVMTSLTEVGKEGLLLQWKIVSGMDGYRVYRREEGQSWKNIRTLMGGSSYFCFDTDVVIGTKYEYTVRGFKKINGVNEWSSYKNPGTVAIAGASILQAVQQTLPEVTVIGGGMKNTVKWTGQDAADGYRIYRKEPGKSWKALKTVMSPKTLSGIDSDLISGNKYTYTVRAFILVNGVAQWSKYNTKGVSIVANNANIRMNMPFLSVKKGGSYQLGLISTDIEPVWSSSDTAIATVDASGKVSGVSYGTVTITADLYGAKYTSSVTVSENASQILKGADLSEWNVVTDYAKVKKQLDFLILRDGYATTQDHRFMTHVAGAKANNIPIYGVYHFCYARNEQDVIQEAKACIANIQAAGLGKDVIVFYDFEYDTVDRAAAAGVKLGKDECTSFTKTFCEYVESQGYKAGFYYNLDYMNRMYDFSKLTKYVRWLAYYNGGSRPQYECQYHQYSCKGEIEGITGDVDMNYCYVDIFNRSFIS